MSVGTLGTAQTGSDFHGTRVRTKQQPLAAVSVLERLPVGTIDVRRKIDSYVSHTAYRGRPGEYGRVVLGALEDVGAAAGRRWEGVGV